MDELEAENVSQISDENRDDGVDRLSQLPDDLLIKILNLLGIMEAPKTHALSRRWKQLWTYCSHLIFIVDGPDGVSPSYVDNVMSRYNGPLECFAIHFQFKDSDDEGYDDYNDEDDDDFDWRWQKYPESVDSWVQFAIDRNATNLQFSSSLTRSSPYNLVPRGVYCGSSLKFLYISCCVLDVPGPIHLNCLKEVQFSNVDFTKETFTSFISGCSVLVSVVLDECNHFSDMSMHITNPSVKCLQIKDGLYDPGDWLDGMEIYAPIVMFMDITGHLRPQYSLIDVSALMSAKLEFHHDNTGNVSILEGLLTGLDGCNLILCSWCIQVLSLSMLHSKPISPVVNVTRLHLKLPLMKCELFGLSRLAELFPLLECLVISFGFWEDGRRLLLTDSINPSNISILEYRYVHWVDDQQGDLKLEDCCWKAIDQGFSCQFQNLKSIYLDEFFWVGEMLGLESGIPESMDFKMWNLFCRELMLLGRLLEHSPVLEKLHIEFATCKYMNIIKTTLRQR